MNRRELVERIEETRKDWLAFNKASQEVRARLQEIEGTEHYQYLHDWAGTQALMNVLTMVLVRLEGQLQDMRAELNNMPAIRLVTEDNDE